MDLLDYLRIIRRRWRILVACVLVAGAAAWVTTPAEPANDDVTYTASHQLLRDDTTFAPPALGTVSLFVKTGEVPIRAAQRLGYTGQPAVLAADIELVPDDQLGTLEIIASGNSPASAAERANVFAEETLALLGEQATTGQQQRLSVVNQRLSSLQAEIDDLNERLQADGEDGISSGTLQAERDSRLRQYGDALDQRSQILNEPPPSAGYLTLQAALPELAEVEGGGFAAPRSRPARTALAAFIGLVLGLIAVLVIERLDTRLHDVHDIAEAFDLPVIAEVPTAARSSRGRIATGIDPMSALAESYRTLRASLLLSPTTVLGRASGRGSRPGEPTVVLVTSAAPGDGKTTTVANLAVAMAETGRTVLVLGCDFRRPEIHTYFGRPSTPGIADVLTRGGGIELTDVVTETEVDGVLLAPSGDQLRSFGDVAAAGRELIRDARMLADFVVIDTPPLLATNDASELIPACDAVVLVSRIDKTTADGARRTRLLLERLGARVSGVIAVGVPERVSAYSSYYTSSVKEPRRAGRRSEFTDVSPPPTGRDLPAPQAQRGADTESIAVPSARTSPDAEEPRPGAGE